MTLLLHTPLTPTLPVGLADSYASLRIEIGSAYTLVFFADHHPPAGRAAVGVAAAEQQVHPVDRL